MKHLDCSEVSDNHSKDRVTVWHGRETPLNVCGYHASRDDLMRDLYRIVAARRYLASREGAS